MINYLYDNYNLLLGKDEIHPYLLTALRRTILNLQMLPESTTVFTDDIAPIEWMTNGMVLNFVLFGGVSNLQ